MLQPPKECVAHTRMILVSQTETLTLFFADTWWPRPVVLTGNIVAELHQQMPSPGFEPGSNKLRVCGSSH